MKRTSTQSRHCPAADLRISFYLAELMAQAGVELGLEPDTARRLAVATLHGSGQLARSSDGDLARLRAEVTSKGGTTEAALKVMKAADLRGIVSRAMDAAARRGAELAEPSSETRNDRESCHERTDFIVQTLLSLVLFVFMLRVLLQLARADFRNPARAGGGEDHESAGVAAAARAAADRQGRHGVGGRRGARGDVEELILVAAISRLSDPDPVLVGTRWSFWRSSARRLSAYFYAILIYACSA